MSPPNKGKGERLAWLRARAGYSGKECLLWPFSTNGTGYGNLGVNGRVCYAHRIMCELVNGPPPLGHEASHSCGNGRGGCVHPMHLSWKTRSDNQRDRKGHGTGRTNKYGRRGKLTEADRAEIVALRGTATQRVLAARFGVHYETISRVQRTSGGRIR